MLFRSLYTNCALDAVGEEYGKLIKDLSEEAAEALINAAALAAQTALDAAKVSDDWADVARPLQPRTDCTHTRRLPPAWEFDVLTNPVDLYVSMAWTYQDREHPSAFCECQGITEEQAERLYTLIEQMLRFALNAAGVDGAWERLYSGVLGQMKKESAV